MPYLQHFGLREPPFSITPDTHFFFACTSVQQALNTLIVAVANGEGFIKITGEVGTGKTLLCRTFLAMLDEAWVSAYVPNPILDSHSLLSALAEEIGAKVEADLDQHQLIRAINRTLLDYARQGKRVVVCLDEAQAMPSETLETLRLLTNLETEKRKLLQVVLFGQPELDDRLAHESIRQLRQRVTFQHRLGYFSQDETRHYLSHRLAVAGYLGDPVFSEAAVRKIYQGAKGIPRLINILANKSMMLAFGEGGRKVDVRHARAAVKDTPAAASPASSWLWVVVACIASVWLSWLMFR